MQRLQRQLSGHVRDVDREWHVNLTLHVAATRERLIPDLWVCLPDAPQFEENEVYGRGGLLAAEVVPPPSRHRNLVEKARAHAQAGVPLYLVVDTYAAPTALTLNSDSRGDVCLPRTHAEAGKTLRSRIRSASS